jgi:hypothetical protein
MAQDSSAADLDADPRGGGDGRGGEPARRLRAEQAPDEHLAQRRRAPRALEEHGVELRHLPDGVRSMTKLRDLAVFVERSSSMLERLSEGARVSRLATLS